MKGYRADGTTEDEVMRTTAQALLDTMRREKKTRELELQKEEEATQLAIRESLNTEVTRLLAPTSQESLVAYFTGSKYRWGNYWYYEFRFPVTHENIYLCNMRQVDNTFALEWSVAEEPTSNRHFLVFKDVLEAIELVSRVRPKPKYKETGTDDD